MLGKIYHIINLSPINRILAQPCLYIFELLIQNLGGFNTLNKLIILSIIRESSNLYHIGYNYHLHHLINCHTQQQPRNMLPLSIRSVSDPRYE